MSHPLKNRPAPAQDAPKPHFDVVRCNRTVGFVLPFLCISDRPFGINVHWSGRSVICPAPDRSCSLCTAGRALRWVGYLAGTSDDRTRQFLVEFTPGVVPAIDVHLKYWHSLRGWQMRFHRPSKKENGSLSLDFCTPEARLAPGDLPGEIDIAEVLQRVYRVNEPIETPEHKPAGYAAVAGSATAAPPHPQLDCTTRVVRGDLNGAPSPPTAAENGTGR